MGRLSVAVVLSVLLGACTFIAGTSSSPTKAGRRDCFFAPPIVDTLFTISGATVFGITLDEANRDVDGEHDDHKVPFRVLGVPSGIVAVIAAVSALHGYTGAAGCRSQQQRDADKIAARENEVRWSDHARRLAANGECDGARKAAGRVTEVDLHGELIRDEGYRACVARDIPSHTRPSTP